MELTNEQSELIQEAIKMAGKILALAFTLMQLKTHISGTLDFGTLGTFELKFTKVEKTPEITNLNT